MQACVLQSCDAYWLPTPFSCFPFTSPPVRLRVPSHFNWTLTQFGMLCNMNFFLIFSLIHSVVITLDSQVGISKVSGSKLIVPRFHSIFTTSTWPAVYSVTWWSAYLYYFDPFYPLTVGVEGYCCTWPHLTLNLLAPTAVGARINP